MRETFGGRGLFLASIAGVVIVLALAVQGVTLFGASATVGASPTAISTATATQVTLTPTSQLPTATPTPSPTPAPSPTPELSRNFDFQPLAVMIDNLVSARPQTGLVDADVVYEALVEAGITRFMAIFTNQSPPIIGPVRSGRHYFIYWATEYNAIYVFAGASPQGYAAANATGISRIDYTYGEGDFWRSRDRVAPHNLYSSVDGLRRTIEDDGKGSLGPVSFKTEGSGPTESGSVANEITIVHPDGYIVEYAYEAASNSYLRQMQRRIHADASNGVQYHPKNVVVQFIRAWRIPGDTAGRMDMELVGEGPAYFFLDGKAIEGKWQKEALTSPTFFLDQHGDKVPFNEGQTWIQIVPTGSELTYE